MRILCAHWSTKAISILLSALMTVGCGSASLFTPGIGNKYIYAYTLTEPVRDDGLLFQDDRIAVAFSVDEAAVTFRLENRTNDRLTVLWSEAVMAVHGEYRRVRHATDLYTDTLDARPFPLPAGGFIRDLLVPHENIYYGESAWVEKPLFPTVDLRDDSVRRSIMDSPGKEISVLLPLEIGGEIVRYAFTLEVSSVREISWKDYVSPQREPRPPPKSRPQTKDERTITIIMVVGFLAMFLLLVSADKEPPSE